MIGPNHAHSIRLRCYCRCDGTACISKALGVPKRHAFRGEA